MWDDRRKSYPISFLSYPPIFSSYLSPCRCHKRIRSSMPLKWKRDLSVNITVQIKRGADLHTMLNFQSSKICIHNSKTWIETQIHYHRWLIWLKEYRIWMPGLTTNNIPSSKIFIWLSEIQVPCPENDTAKQIQMLLW